MVISPAVLAADGKPDSSVLFSDLCERSLVYEPRDCRCISRKIEQNFEGKDRKIAYLYGRVAVMAEQDLLALRNYVLSKKCDSIPLSDAMAELSRHHNLPVFLFRELYLLDLTKEQYFDWGEEKEFESLWKSCHRPTSQMREVEEDLMTCLSTTEGLEDCSRCHDGQGIELSR
ncbi:hypothetical protein ACTL6U_01775 [Rhodovibrionaceae bacterium A322]